VVILSLLEPSTKDGAPPKIDRLNRAVVSQQKRAVRVVCCAMRLVLSQKDPFLCGVKMLFVFARAPESTSLLACPADLSLTEWALVMYKRDENVGCGECASSLPPSASRGRRR
jgi:hypothetical protein